MHRGKRGLQRRLAGIGGQNGATDMLGGESAEKVYLATGFTDMRKSIDGLAAIVKLQFKLDPLSPCLFVFCNRGRNKIKILRWDHNGFWLYYRRLERGYVKSSVM